MNPFDQLTWPFPFMFWVLVVLPAVFVIAAIQVAIESFQNWRRRRKR